MMRAGPGRRSLLPALLAGCALLAILHLSLSPPSSSSPVSDLETGLPYAKTIGVAAAAIAAASIPRLMSKNRRIKGPKKKTNFKSPALDTKVMKELNDRMGKLVTCKFPNTKDVILCRLLKTALQGNNLYATLLIENGKVGTEVAANVVRDMAMKGAASETLSTIQREKAKLGKDPTLTMNELMYVRQIAFRASLGAVTNGTSSGVEHMVPPNSSVITVQADCVHFPPLRELEYFDAVNKGDMEKVTSQIEHGVSPDADDDSGRSALYFACREGKEEIAKKLISLGCKVDKMALNGATPTFVAAQSGHLGIVQALLAAGADVKSPKNVTYPFIACQNGHLDILNLFLDKGADAALPSMNGFSCLYIAAQNGHKNIIERLLELPSTKLLVNHGMAARSMATPVLIASQMGHLEVVKTLVAHGADIKQPMTDGTTPFKVACAQGDPELIEYLLEKGADIESPNKDQNTALMAAIIKSNVRAVELLLKRGANPNAKSSDGRDPITLARATGNPEILQIISKAAGVKA
ncbi:hypothetical protein AAMO2058_001022500 [Amorphochlora amoebiformis]